MMIEDVKFNGVNFSLKKMEYSKYEACTFEDCDFSNTHLTGKVFIDCVFDKCDFSNATLGDTGFREVKFKDSKLLGLHFEHCNPLLLSFQFEGCTLNFSSFYKMKISNTVFNNCSLKEVDFTGSDLRKADFESSDLTRAVFENTNLEHSDLRTAYGFSIDPSSNKIKKATFSQNNLHGLLSKYHINIEG